MRSEGFGLAGIQFTKRANYEKTLEKGELYPELAYLLCLISDPKQTDIFLDPFAGHGSIPRQRMSFPYTKIIIGDRDLALVDELRKKTTGRKKNIEISSLDALHLNNFENDSIATIVTDPPWGMYKSEEIDVAVFYKKMLEEFCRVVAVGGMIVILTAQKELIKSLLRTMKNRLKHVAKYDTLVSGKKAAVYKIIKLR